MSSDRLAKALEFADAISNFQTMGEASDELDEFVRAFGFECFVLATFTGLGSLKAPYVLANSWSREWTEKYLREAFILDDPLVAKAGRVSIPFFYRDALDNPAISDRGRKIVEEARKYFPVDGAFVPFYGPYGLEGCMSLGGDTAHISDGDLKALHVAGLYAYRHFLVLLQNGIDRSEAGNVLTKRETECLKWSAAGKTSTDIAEVLGISRHTADWYLKEATRKLGASNRTHAVAIAFRLGLVA
ncbi:LuxR family transcriptional regulator [Roseibium sp. RKSG952]|uniref:helix-turn-helix transcriptional regulator n=1 Tax=Roseibium sp. RKSG952 TaxID=2529384 RepID=UPI0012BB6A7B|nr:LuxR family transcriptional regulator [Roseibium sp. RKSG952]MTH96914.1 LuxR family transcriptional regulator [Roseibium sp. RKSG952]